MFGPVQVPPQPVEYKVHLPMVQVRNFPATMQVSCGTCISEDVLIVDLNPTVLVTTDEGLFEQWAQAKMIVVNGEFFTFVESFIWDRTTVLNKDYLFIFIRMDGVWYGASYEPVYAATTATTLTIGE